MASPHDTLPSRLKLGLAGLCAAAGLGLFVLFGRPLFVRWPYRETSMLSVHMLLELVAIVVAMLVVTAAWFAFERQRARAGGIIIAGFLTVACCDIVHSLTYEGMPALLQPASTERAIFFWLAGRSVEVVTLGLLAVVPTARLARGPALALGIALSAFIVWLGSYRLDLFPTTFVPGVGVTPFKAACEYGLCIANGVVALLLWRRATATGQIPLALLAASAFVMGVGELAFSSYVSPSDFQNIFGHLYKVVAYTLLYRATFVAGFRAPYEALRASEARARESELRIRSLGDNLPHCMVYQLVRGADGSRRFTYLSDGARQAHGVDPTDALRDPMLLYLQVLPEDRAGLATAEARSAETMELFDRIVRIRRADGELRWMHLFSRPRRLDECRIAWDGVEIDITERQFATEERERLEMQLRESQKMEAIGTLAGGIAHDFNNVLGAIVGNLALAREELAGGRETDAARSLEQIERAAHRARDLVQKILGFSRRRPPQRSPQAVRPVVDECLGLLRATIPANVSFEAHLGEQEAFAIVDASELQQIVMNLATNAWQALQGRNGVITIGLDVGPLAQAEPADAPALPPGEYVHLWVRDDGCGMNEATRQRIFEPFFTTRLHDGGTGLGLSVVHGIVRAQGGAVTVDSAPGCGSTFHVYLPAVAPAAAQAPAAAAVRRPQRRSRLLYVDDDEVMGLMVERLLARDGHEVTVFRDPEPALAAVAAAPGRFGVVITDYSMPALSGLDVAERVHALEPRLPVIVSSGHVSAALEAQAPRFGVFRLIEKQNTLEELPAAVQDALAQREEAAAL